jgi:D-sedoheptulose 7-phosphate isomerase
LAVQRKQTNDGTWAERTMLHARAALDGFLAEPGNVAKIERVSGLLAERFGAGRKVLICGNGGSACDAMHFAEELTGRFRAPPPGSKGQDRPPLPVIACTDPGHITCTANDYGYEHVFARWVRAFGQRGDVLIVLSTSGNSKNVVLAVEAAKSQRVETVALLGSDGGVLRGKCDHEWIVKGTDAAGRDDAGRVQEVHMLILHALIEGVERAIVPENYRD